MGSIDLVKYEQLKAAGDLPSPKGSALAIIRLTQKSDVALNDLERAVKTDPAFVGRLIKAANSVHVGGRRPIVSVHDALIILGIPAVRGLALGFSLLSDYRSGKCRRFDYGHFWSHSLASAVAFQALTLRTRAAPAEEAFAIGLLMGIGRLALATMFPEQYSGLIDERERDTARALHELEQQAFVLTHCELSAAMMHDWGLPKVFYEPVLFQERPEHGGFVEGSRQYTLVWSLALAGHIGEMCLARDDERRAMMGELLLLGSKLSIDAEALTLLCDQVAVDWQSWAAMLGVGAQAVAPFADLGKAPELIGRGSQAVGETEAAPSLRVLVADDEASIRALLKTILVQAGHEVFEAEGGQQAFEMALDLRPQLIVADWMMPGLDGIALTRALRETRIGRGIYIIVITSAEDDDRMVAAFEAGVDDFLAKPIRPRILEARLRAGQRVVQLQQEVERDREEIRRFAAELAVTNRRLQEAALTDPLTGLPNRRYAVDHFQQDWAAASRTRRPLACMLIDVDEFKEINDTHGHDVGDEVLKQATTAIKKGLRAQDILARLGGDEFLVICPDTDLGAAMACAERARRLVEAAVIQAGAVKLKGSVSIGVAARQAGMPGIDALIKEADRGVYKAKQGGRNRVSTVQGGD